jgi:hypothetical protein
MTKFFVTLFFLAGATAWGDSNFPLSCWSREARFTGRVNYSVWTRVSEDSKMIRLYVHQNVAKVGKSWVADIEASQFEEINKSGVLIIPMQRIVRGVLSGDVNSLLRLKGDIQTGQWKVGSFARPGLEDMIIDTLDCTLVKK